MKLVHKKAGDIEEQGDLLTRAKIWEREGESDKAIKAFERIIKENPLHEYAYNRLMILFRKSNEYRKEKAIIAAGIKAFQQLHKRTLKLPYNRSVKALSTAISKATGLEDKKGQVLYEREPIGRWRKRMEVVKKKLANA